MKKLLSITLLFFFLSTYAQVDVKAIDKYIEQARKDWDVPGMSVGVVKDGKVVLSKGYGVKELGKSDKVDDNTLFAIASNSKAFVASCIAKLVEEGKLSWKDKVRDYLPYFTLYGDEYISSMVTVEDLLCHRVGLGTFSGDVIWYKSEKSPEEIIKRAAHVPKAFEFRDGYGYSNLMFITAGEVIRTITGEPWENYVKTNFMEPLGMSNTVISVNDLNDNVATPHKPTIDRGTEVSEWASWDAPSAAGGIISSSTDMAKWMMMNLNGGEWNGITYIDKEQQNLLWTPHANFKISEQSKESLPGVHFRGYGLGWSLMDYHGNLVVSHGGGYDGMYSRVVMVPDQELGIVVLTNSMEGISSPLAMYIVNQFIQKDMRDWSAEYLERARSRNGHKEEVEERRTARVMDTKPALTQEEMIGTYNDPMYGDITISEKDGNLRIEFQDAPELGASLTHWHYDTYQINWDEEHAWFDFGTVSFEMDNNLKVEGIEFDVPNGDIFFHELHPKRVY
ncbi:CubicO group peptidase, beta-lactamase class C family [Ekhidna lutea]|uniref:CubicO group peptidase, beta-lactamase class C family n=1 Tax=Ekhidna lutea TaxID=447679 RepID=A0A239JG38_EKHLU|nr:serine hydrolase [Ekhidna lutea]SNT04790.1 CubicO group peptidase, beta-lactamase class C family [Ekhidna lutea]